MSNETTKPLCRECKWAAVASRSNWYVCTHRKSMSLYSDEFETCYRMRTGKATDNSDGVCGLDGKLWESRPPQSTFWQRFIHIMGVQR